MTSKHHLPPHSRFVFQHSAIIMSSRVENILQSLTLEEKISLLAGKDFWETVPIPAKGVPAIKVRRAMTSASDKFD